MNSKLYSSFILLLLCTSLVSAVLVSEPPSGVPIDDATFEDTSDGVLNMQVVGGFGGFTNKLFRNAEDLTFSKVIVFYALLVMFFFTFLNIIPFVPFLKGLKAYLLSAALTVLMGLSGTYSLITESVFFISQAISDKWSSAVLLGMIIVLSVILTIFNSIMKKVYSSQNVGSNEDAGIKLATDIAIAKKEAEIPKGV